MYNEALKQWWKMILRFLPKIFKFLGKSVDWKTEKNIAFYDDKYIPIVPQQGTFLYMQARAVNAKNILEFGTSYGISTIYLARLNRWPDLVLSIFKRRTPFEKRSRYSRR